MNLRAASLISVLFGMGFNPFRGRSEPSSAQKRMHAAWLEDAPRRNALAAEIAEWNGKVKRRNQRFVRRNAARGRTT